MDLWVVGAAAAAGYIAKYWQNVSRDNDSLSESGTSKGENHEIPNCPFSRLTWRKKVADGTSTVERLSDMHHLQGVPEEVSTSGYVDKVGNLENYEQNIFSLSSLPLGVSTNENLKDNYVEQELSGNRGDNTDGMDSFHDSTKKMSSLRTKHSYGRFIRPLSSLDSCVMAQLYKEHVKMEEYVFSSFPSPSATTRPLLVTDGNRTINRTNGAHFSAQIGTEDYRLCEKDNVCGVTPLPKISGLDICSKMKSNTQKRNNGGLNNKSRSRRRFHSQNGSLDQTILFCLGVCLGIVSSLLTSIREVDKLKDLLKHSENLVQDLQEELEMKDSLTVKELAHENCESQDACENSFHNDAPNRLLPVQDMDSSTMNLTDCGKAAESSEDMSRIEAELEAELERLGLNLNTSGMETRLSDLVEVDPDFVADFAQGELRTDMVDMRSSTGPESEQDASGTSTKSGNYAVSPRELSLRLHEVIQSRLEERVKKLEMALQDSERKVHAMESELKNGQRKLLSSKLRYSSGDESPITEEDFKSMGQPLVMNLSGEALDAYNEACEELMKIDESEEDNSPSGIYVNNQQGTQVFSQSTLWDKKGMRDGYMIPHSDNKEKPSGEVYLNQLKASIEHIPQIQQWCYDGASEDECNAEMEQQLIKQIVEKTKKGSPAVINAQRVFFLLDENDH